MGKQAEKTKVPHLRFPNFSANWTETPFSQIGTTYSGLSGKSAEDFGSGKPFIRYMQIFSRSCIVPSECGFVKVHAGERQNPVRYGDILFTTSSETPAEVGFSSVFMSRKRGVYLNSFSFGLRPHSLKDLDPGFAQYLFRSHTYRLLVRKLAQGSTRFNIAKTQFLNLTLPIPPPNEQKKIAMFLQTVDVQLEGLQSRLEALTEYKRGIMQKLFSQSLRFTQDNGTPFPDWQEIQIGEIGDIVSGGTPDTQKSEFWNGDIQWFTPTEIKSKYLSQSERKISKLGLKLSSASLLPVGTLLLSTRATIGKIAIATERCTTNQGFQSIIVNQNEHNEFWYYWILKHKSKFINLANGSTFAEITKSLLEEIVALRPHPDEQQKIADFLSTIDQRLKAITGQVTSIEAFKKSLLQQMFI